MRNLFDNNLANIGSSPVAFLKYVETFNLFGESTRVENVDGIPYFLNEFWTSKQRKSNSIHEISYRACFKAQLPEFFIEQLTKQGDVVFDPFMGRGTTLVQAALMNRHAFGNDINPLSKLLTRPKLRSIKYQDIIKGLDSVDWDKGEIEREDLLAFYHPKTLKKIEALKLWLKENAPLNSDDVDPVADWIRMVAINRLSGHSAGFFSGKSMPPNQAVSVKSQLKINEKHGVDPPERDVAGIILKKSKSLLRDCFEQHTVPFTLKTELAWSTSLPDSSVDLVVTSPPFLDVVQYADDNWLRCWFSDIDPNSIEIAMHKTESAWEDMVHQVLKELYRLMKTGGYVAFEVG